MTAYKTIFGRRFSRNEQKKLECGVSLCCFVIAFTIFMSYFASFSINIDVKSVEPIVSNFSNSRSDMYELKGDIRIHGNSSTIFIASSQQENYSFTIKPYARKQDKSAMRYVNEFKITNEGPHAIPHCTRYFNTPAVIFSLGGYTGNLFHDFTDVLIPLYLTSRQLNATPIFLITDNKSCWTSKYNLVFQKLSKHDLIDIDNENAVLCFSRMVVGLKAHERFRIDPIESPFSSATDFTKFLRSTYSLKRHFVNGHDNKRPRLLIISREKTRRLMNEAQLADMSRSMGFDVVVREMKHNVLKVAEFVNSFDVMMGVHGAGLTNMVFLPEKAVVIQIVPFGLDLLAKPCFQIPAEDMNLRYLEYKVSLNESSLLGKYPIHSEFYRDPVGVHNKGWHGFSSVYLDSQNVNLDLSKFRETLSQVLNAYTSKYE